LRYILCERTQRFKGGIKALECFSRGCGARKKKKRGEGGRKEKICTQQEKAGENQRKGMTRKECKN